MGLENPVHIAFVLMIMLLVFGAKRLPEMGRGLGSGMRGFKDALSGVSTSELPAAEAPADPTPAAVDQPTLIQTGATNE